MDGYMIDGIVYEVNLARRFQDMVLRAPLIIIDDTLKNKIMQYMKPDEELLVITYDFDTTPGRMTILSVKTYKECLLEIF